MQVFYSNCTNVGLKLQEKPSERARTFILIAPMWD